MTGFTATFQGRLVKVKTERSSTQKITPPVARRGDVESFSRKSRKRMLELVSTINIPEKTYFVTLTFPDAAAPQSGKLAKAPLRALFERIRRRWPESSAIWRMEIKRRKSGHLVGHEVPHFHLLIFNCALQEETTLPGVYPQGWLASAWQDILKVPYARIDCQKLNSARGVMHYCSKYVAKQEQPSRPLVSLPYLHDQGRHWGVFNRSALPQFHKSVVVCEGRIKAFQDFRRAYKRVRPQIASDRRWQGFTVFSDDSERWYDYLLSLIDALPDR